MPDSSWKNSSGSTDVCTTTLVLAHGLNTHGLAEWQEKMYKSSESAMMQIIPHSQV